MAAWAENAFGMGFGGRMVISGGITYQIGDGSKGYLLVGMCGGMTALAVVIHNVH